RGPPEIVKAQIGHSSSLAGSPPGGLEIQNTSTAPRENPFAFWPVFVAISLRSHQQVTHIAFDNRRSPSIFVLGFAGLKDQKPGFKVHLWPLNSKHLALAHPGHEGRHKERLELVGQFIAKPLVLLIREETPADVVLGDERKMWYLVDLRRCALPALVEGAAENGKLPVDRGVLCPFARALLPVPLHHIGRQTLRPDGSEGRADILFDYLFIDVAGGLFDVRADQIVKQFPD